VADLAKSPLKDQSFHALLNILSPANYKEFKRVLVRGGLAVKVVPGPHYLRELRETLFADKAKKVYQNEEMVSLFAKHFRVMDVCKVSYTRMLDYDELEHLMRMTPLAWSADQKDRDAFVQRNAAEITVDLDILAGIHE
jgi:23S rRNA (guanine745-N1)-methyltransferase